MGCFQFKKKQEWYYGVEVSAGDVFAETPDWKKASFDKLRIPLYLKDLRSDQVIEVTIADEGSPVVVKLYLQRKCADDDMEFSADIVRHYFTAEDGGLVRAEPSEFDGHVNQKLFNDPDLLDMEPNFDVEFFILDQEFDLFDEFAIARKTLQTKLKYRNVRGNPMSTRAMFAYNKFGYDSAMAADGHRPLHATSQGGVEYVAERQAPKPCRKVDDELKKAAILNSLNDRWAKVWARGQVKKRISW